ncbi:FAD-dependent oxidoreductase [Lapidilactobacillus salsurivasis]
MLTFIKKKDMVVIGGGLAGICAAISAARLGRSVALVHNRSMLGGNSSSEIRVWVSSATKHGVNRYARETGIMGELFVENQYRNIDGNPYIWDALLLEKVISEKNIELFLNTEITKVFMEGESIKKVSGNTLGSEQSIDFEAPFFIDCTGDGVIGYLAGADFRLGREGKDEFNESLAPNKPDSKLMGSSLLFYSKEENHKVEFIPPSFAKNIAQTEIAKNRIIHEKDSGAKYWWIEFGGELDVVHDNEAIKGELLSLIYGLWDYIKNSGKYNADNMTLEWVGTVPGKREYRRLLGDYVLKQSDIEEQTPFPDTIGFGGWSIDLHPSRGIYNESGGAYHSVADGIYPIPYRMLYSRNIANLFMAGRDISASHVALGGVRIMGTCALMGEAVGTACSLAVEKKCSPREIYQLHLPQYLQLLLRNDASVIGYRNLDADDLARTAEVSSSGHLREINTYVSNYRKYKLNQSVAVSFPVNPKLSAINVPISARTNTTLKVELWQTGKPQNYIPQELIDEQEVKVSKGELNWIRIPFNWSPEHEKNAFVIFRSNSDLELLLGCGKYPGVLSYVNIAIEEMNHPDLHKFTRESPVLHWTTQLIHNQNFIFNVEDETEAFVPQNIINGYVRPYSGPNMWTMRFGNRSEWVQLKLNGLVTISEIRLTFDDDVNEDLINLHHHYTEHPAMPEIVKDFRILYNQNGSWQELLNVTGNHVRHRVFKLENRVVTDNIRLEIMNTNGSEFMSIYEIRLYGRVKKCDEE